MIKRNFGSELYKSTKVPLPESEEHEALCSHLLQLLLGERRPCRRGARGRKHTSLPFFPATKAQV